LTLIKSISGIRGTIGGPEGQNLTPFDVTKYAAAFGAWVLENGKGKKIIIGRDARPSGAWISQITASTLRAMGLDIIDLGLSTTPTVEMAVAYEQAGGGIILTASHNPIQWNALKLLNHEGEFISAEEGARVLELAESGQINFAPNKSMGTYLSTDKYLHKHIEAIMALPLVDKTAISSRNFKVIIDPVNSVGAIAIPMLLDALGVKDYTIINGEPNGHFAHNPEPLPENLNQIAQELEHGHFDLGIVVDPDVDRLAFMCEDGSAFGEEYTLVAVADYVLSQTPGNTVSNLSSTRALKDVTLKYGGEYTASAVGEVNVVKAMKATKSVIGGEGNGGIIYPSLHYGRDALMGIALFLSHLAKFGKSASMLLAKYPQYHISKNKIELTPDIDMDRLLERIQTKYARQPLNTADGVRIDFDAEWVHLRKSNTEPIIRIYAESSTEATANHLAQKLIVDIKEIITGNE